MITAERLRELFRYDPTTGVFVRLKSRGAAKGGAPSGCLSPIGYLQIRIDGKLYYAHRLAWLYVHGVWPADMIDHADGRKINNRIANLREATNQQNLRNMARLRSDNTSGFKGVYWDKRRETWIAATSVNGKFKWLGSHPTREAAHEAYMVFAKAQYGEFARSAESTRRAELSLGGRGA